MTHSIHVVRFGSAVRSTLLVRSVTVTRSMQMVRL